MNELVLGGRLPITEQNIEVIIQEEDTSIKSIINQHSSEAALTIIGFRHYELNLKENAAFSDYDALGNVLFVNSKNEKVIS